MKLRSIVAAAALLAVTGAQAVEIFSDDFDAAIEGLSIVPTGWTVTDGTVDVVGTVFPLCEGTGLCVDLDGSSGDAGVLSRNFNLQGGVLYTLSFDVAGSQRGSVDDVEVRFGSAVLNLDDIASATLVTDGNGAVLVRTDGELVDLVRRGQGVLSIVALGGVKEALDAAITDLPVPSVKASRAAHPAASAGAGGGGG